MYDYTKKKDVIFSKIIAQESSPPWVFDRQRLWSLAVAAGRRADSQDARQITVALPCELGLDAQIALLTRFANHLNAMGMVADVNLHSGGRTGRNFHGHIMTPMRHLVSSGFGTTNRAWNDRTLVKRLREVYQEMANEALASAGSSSRISHRSLADQGLLRKPTRHLGARLSAMAREGNEWAMAQVIQQRGAGDDFENVRAKYFDSTISALRNVPVEHRVGTSTGSQSHASDPAIDPGIRKPNTPAMARRHR
jgi:MobA/MobL family